MNGNEHRSIGDEAFGGAHVNLGGESAQERFWLGYGDVMALSGDYFRPEASLDVAARDGRDHLAGSLFGQARVPGQAGTRPDTRDEIVCALKVMTVDEAPAHARR